MFRFLLVTFLIGLPISVAAQADNNAIAPELTRFGMQLYNDNCAICHGPKGMGDGVLSSEFVPPPRNFTNGTFKFISSETGEPPTRADLIKIIEYGIEGRSGRSMPAFPDLSSSEKIALAEIVRQFADIDAYGIPLTIPPRPSEINLERGRALYEANGCTACHGANGAGDGQLAASLEDENSHPIEPANFVLGKLKRGNSAMDIWLSIYGGINGTPMPSFGRSLSSLDIWQLSFYVESLANN